MKISFQTVLTAIKEWLKPPRSLRITKGGWQFLGLTLLIGLAAVNTGNNLLYLVFGLMLSFITVSGILSELMLRRIRIHRIFPRRIFAGQAAPVSIAVTNHKKRIASFSLLIEDFSQENHAEHSRYILKILVQTTEMAVYPVIFAQRGLHHPGKVRLSTRYPFGFFRKSVTFVEADEEILVYPQFEKFSPLQLSSLASQAEVSTVSKKKGNSHDVHSIREYIQGDNNARIHWKSTAKLAKLMIKEFEAEQRKKIALFLDVSLPSTNIPVNYYQDVERAISLAASYALYFLKKDFQLQLVTPMQTSSFDKGQRHLFKLLRMLALLQASNGNSHRQFLQFIRASNRTDVMRILISANTPKEYTQENFSKIVYIRSS